MCIKVELLEDQCVKKYPVKALAFSFPYLAICEGTDALLLLISSSAENKIQKVPIILHGHHDMINLLKFGRWGSNDQILFSAASDYIISWNINKVCVAQQNGQLVRGRVLCSCSEVPHYISLSHDSSRVCVVSECSLLIIDFNTKKNVMDATTRGICAAEFLDDKKIVATFNSGKIMLMDVDDQATIWEKHCSRTFTSLLCCEYCNKFSVGSTMTTVEEFLFHSKEKLFKESMKIDLDEELMHMDEQYKNDGNTSRDHVIALMYHNHSPDDNINVLSDTVCLLCATERGIFTINCQNQYVSASGYTEEANFAGPPVASRACFSKNDRGKIICAVAMMLEPMVLILSIDLAQPTKHALPSFVSSTPLTKSSVLLSSLKLKKPEKPKNDQAVTFKNKVKSSGYATAPRMTMFKPNTSASKKPAISKPIKSTRTLHSQSTSNPDWLENVGVTQSLLLSEKDSVVNCIAVNDQCRYVACCLSDASVHVSDINKTGSINPKAKVIIAGTFCPGHVGEKMNDISHIVVGTGHGRSVDGCHWSHNKDLLMTYSSSREIKLWCAPFSNEPILSFEPEYTGKAPKDLVHAQLYYVDQFILAGLGNSLLLFKFVLQERPKDDIKRYLNQSKKKLIGEWTMKTAQTATCMTAPNSIYSYITLMGGSDRTVDVFDLNVGQHIYAFQDVHTRPIHAIHHAVNSSVVTSGLSDVFITSAASDGIKLWDLRSQRCMRKLNRHQCVSKCDVTISCCGKFIATATDNKAVCVYDVRKPFPLHTVALKDRVTSLTFTPDSKQVLVGNGLSSTEVVSSV